MRLSSKRPKNCKARQGKKIEQKISELRKGESKHHGSTSSRFPGEIKIWNNNNISQSLFGMERVDGLRWTWIARRRAENDAEKARARQRQAEETRL